RLRELLEVQAYFGLPSPALVEKDFYVVKALAAIAAIDTAPLRLVFGGGTALSRAHRLVRRMSEDIDLRIVGDKPPGRGALRRPPEVTSMACVSILETVADKFVGLTRRAGAELAGLDEPDPTLVRHLHDLHALREHYDPADVIVLAREVMLADAEAYGNQF